MTFYSKVAFSPTYNGKFFYRVHLIYLCERYDNVSTSVSYVTVTSKMNKIWSRSCSSKNSVTCYNRKVKS